MASGKTIRLGNLKINFSSRGIAAKKAGEEKIWRWQYPWYKSEEERERKIYASRVSEDDGGYDDEDDEEEYEEDGEVYGRYDQLLESGWLMWVLLILLPPVGVWLLWRQRRYDITTRSIVSLVGVVWFIVLLILLFGLFSGSRDSTLVPIATRMPVVSATTDPGSQTNGVGSSGGAPAADETGAPSGDGSAIGAGGTQTEPDDEENIPAITATPDLGAAPTPLAAVAATPVPTEEPEDTADPQANATEAPNDDNTYIYCTTKGKYYHSYATCTGMVGASKVLISVAKGMGKTACPTCIGDDGLTPVPKSESTEGSGSSDNAPTATATPSKSGPYYATQGGVYYHKNPTCSGMKGAVSITAAKATAAGKKPCPTCVGSVYATATGKYYHKTSNCSGMQGASLVTVAAAKARGQVACPTCMGTGGTVYYATATGKYYHVLANCSGMQNATQVSAATAQKRNQTPCPTCIGDKNTTYYYATDSGKYYHSNKYCSDMAGAKQVTLAVAKSRGQTACPVCLKSASQSTQTTQTSGYYSTANGKYYHKTATCSGMQGATQVSLATINQRGQTACPVCLGSVASYYSTKDGEYYHKTANCSGMLNADKVSYATALSRGQTACPVCLGGTAKANTSTAVKYYYGTKNGKYYHSTATCSGMQNATKMTLTAAKADGKTACPVCLSSATAYYATTSGKYYHKTATCSGMQGAVKVSYATAVKRGQTACPVCLGGTVKSATGTTTSSGTTYYGTPNGKYYHTNKYCSNMAGAVKVTLAAAKARGQTACPVCAGGQKTTASGTTSSSNSSVNVWVSEDKKYHSRQYCSGNTESYITTLAYAKSKGYSRCTVCNAP